VVLEIGLPVHTHQAVVVDFYFAPTKGAFPPHVDVDPLHSTTDPRCFFAFTPPFVPRGSGL